MCGISGIFSNSSTSLSKINILRDSLVHRGPDNSKSFFGSSFAVAHNRLSIIDIDERSNQPFYFKDLILVFNGEIYNYIELRDVLIENGYEFETSSDTEVVIKSFHFWGEDCFNKFNGMWALSICNLTNNTCLICRDRFGIKPLYYFFNESEFYFASEIKALLNIDVIKNEQEINEEVAVNFLLHGLSDYDENTFFSNIKQIEPGNYITYNLINNKFDIKKYYFGIDNYSKSKKNFTETKSEFNRLFKSSCEIKLRSDVPLASLLSGGIDSSSIISTLHLINKNQNITCYHGVNVDDNYTELEYAKNVAMSTNNDLVTVETPIDFFEKNIINTHKIQDEPFTSLSIVFQYSLFNKIKDDGFKVVFDGQGGDESWLGYERYFFVFFKKLSFFKKIPLFFSFMKNNSFNVIKFFQYYIYFSSATLRKLLLIKKYKKVFPNVKTHLNEKYLSSFGSLVDLQNSEINSFQLRRLLRYEDRNSMSVSLESRLPFLDYRLVELGVSTPPEFHFNAGFTKSVLRSSFTDIIDDKVLYRNFKLGFNSPDSIFINNNYNYIKNTISQSNFLSLNFDLTKIPDDNSFLWRLFSFSVWEKYVLNSN